MQKRTKNEPVQYVLGADIDIAGMVWRKDASVHVIAVNKLGKEYYDIFLTHKKEYAKRGSHAPVTRLEIAHVSIVDNTLTITETDDGVVPAV